MRSGRRLSFEVFEDVVECLVDGLFQTLANDVVHHLLNQTFLFLAFLLFVAHFFTLPSMTMFIGSSSSSFWCLAL